MMLKVFLEAARRAPATVISGAQFTLPRSFFAFGLFFLDAIVLLPTNRLQHMVCVSVHQEG